MRINKAENWKELNKDVQEQGLSSRQARRENGLLVSCSHSERLDVSNEEFFAILAKSNGKIPNQEIEKDRKKTKNIKHSGNISLDDVIEIARVMKPRLMAKELARIVKEILGSCVSVGCTVEILED